MYEHHQDYYGGYRGFWKVPDICTSLDHWSSFPLVESEHREINADDQAGVNAHEFQQEAQLEREAAVRRLALRTAREVHAAAAAEAAAEKHPEPAAAETPPEPSLSLIPRPGVHLTPRDEVVQAEGISQTLARSQPRRKGFP